MKKATMEVIRDTLTAFGMKDTDPVMVELNAELNKGAEAKAARTAAYEGIHRVIVDNLTGTPVPFSDLWPEIEPEVIAKGMTKHNAQWALNNLWQDEIVRTQGNPNTYARKS